MEMVQGVPQPERIRYERHSSRSWGASALRGSCRQDGAEVSVGERKRRGAGTDKLDGDGSLVEKVYSWVESCVSKEQR
jgi:hypothetical protein